MLALIIIYGVKTKADIILLFIFKEVYDEMKLQNMKLLFGKEMVGFFTRSCPEKPEKELERIERESKIRGYAVQNATLGFCAFGNQFNR